MLSDVNYRIEVDYYHVKTGFISKLTILSSLQSQVMSFMIMMDEDRIRLTGSRVFKVGRHLIPPVKSKSILF